MINVKILEKDDILKKGDWCRPLALCTMSGGQSDDYSFNNCYSGKPENNVKWCRVGLIMPAWIGNTVGEYLKLDIGDYEFIRGAIPKRHTITLANGAWS